MTTTLIPSVPEIVRRMLNAQSVLIAQAPAGAVVGPASDEQQVQGVVSIMEAGLAGVDENGITLGQRLSLRCLSHSLEQTERISRAVYTVAHGRGRTIVADASNNSYLIHSVLVNGGPSTHKDSDVTWESLMFIEVLMAVTPVRIA